MLQQLSRKRLLDAGYIELGMDQFVLPGEALLLAQAQGRLQRQFMGYTPAQTQVLVGLGVSALSASHASYMQNEKGLQQYEARLQQGQLPLQRGHLLSPADQSLRQHIMALLNSYHTRWQPDDVAADALTSALQRLAPLQTDGLVELGERQIGVTTTGRTFLRTICMALDARLLARAPQPNHRRAPRALATRVGARKKPPRVFEDRNEVNAHSRRAHVARHLSSRQRGGLLARRKPPLLAPLPVGSSR